MADSADARLPLFPGAGTDAYTVAELGGVVDVRASGYGSAATYAPAERPDQAFDGKVGTAWKVGDVRQPGRSASSGRSRPGRHDRRGHPGPAGRLRHPTAALPSRRRRLEQPVVAPGTRLITKVTLTFDGKDPITRNVDLGSLGPDGQQITFPPRSFKQLAIRIDATNLPQDNGQGANGVGFSEVRIGAGPNTPQADEVLRMPTDLLDRPAPRPAAPAQPDHDERPGQSGRDLHGRHRAGHGPQLRPSVGTELRHRGSAMVSARAPDQEVDRWLGRPDPAITDSSSRLAGDLAARSSSALDGDPTTAWSPALGPQVGNWISAPPAPPGHPRPLDDAGRRRRPALGTDPVAHPGRQPTRRHRRTCPPWPTRPSRTPPSACRSASRLRSGRSPPPPRSS